jgi:hypothetical protein
MLVLITIDGLEFTGSEDLTDDDIQEISLDLDANPPTGEIELSSGKSVTWKYKKPTTGA